MCRQGLAWRLVLVFIAACAICGVTGAASQIITAANASKVLLRIEVRRWGRAGAPGCPNSSNNTCAG
jgi:hypothetical protein